MQHLQAFILRSKSAGARGVDDQQHLTLEPLQGNVLAGKRRCREIVNAGHRVSFQRLGSDLADGIDRRRRRSTGFDRLAREQAEVLAVAAGDDLNADGNASHQSRGDR